MVSSRNTRHLWSLEHRLRKRLWIFAHRVVADIDDMAHCCSLIRYTDEMSY